MTDNDVLDRDDRAEILGIRDAAMKHQLDDSHGFDGRRSRRAMEAIKARINLDDDPEYLEAMILTRLIGGAPPRRVKRPLQRLYYAQCARGEAAAFERFREHLEDVSAQGKLAGDLVFHTTLADLDHAALWDQTRVMMHHVATHVGPCWLNSGTLLGSVREGAFIGHDDDVDLAVLLQGDTHQEVAASWINAYHKLSASGLALHVPARDKRVIKVVGNDVKIDLFPAWMQGDRVFVYPHTAGALQRDDLLPFGACRASGLPVPQNPEAFLELNYGAQWQVPDPSFTFDWKASNAHFKDFRTAIYADPDAFEPR
ncbi:MAG: LicD family protein [Sulfitobacter sp.]